MFFSGFHLEFKLNACAASRYQMAIVLALLFLRALSTMLTGFRCLLLGLLPRRVCLKRTERSLSGHKYVQVRTVNNILEHAYSR